MPSPGKRICRISGIWCPVFVPMADADDVYLALLDPIEDQVGFMALNAVGSGKLCTHPVCLRKFCNEPERFMQRPLIGYGLLLSELADALPIDCLQIDDRLTR